MSGFGKKLLLYAVLVVAVLLPTMSHAQIVNGDFSGGATGWTSTGPADSTLVFGGGQLTATSDDNGGGQSTTLATQTFTAADPGFLSYLLVSYTSTDVPDWDWPLFRVNATNFRISTTGTLIASTQNIAGAVTNATGATNLSGATTLPAGTHTVGPGVFAQDSQLGPGIAIWDNIDFQEITQSPVAQTTLENNALTLTGANAPATATNPPTGTIITVTLSVTSGIINLGSPGSVTITGGADGSATVTFTGSPANINTAMDGLIYTPNLNFVGGDTLVYAASGGGIADTDNIPITVTAGTRTMSVTKIANDDTDVTLGQVITYTYRVTNTGDQFISNVTLSDSHGGSGPAPTPAGEALAADNAPLGDSTDAASNGSWDTLAPGDEVTFTGTYTVTQNDIDTLQ
jgi:hypothetical protein